ncbi:MAG: glycosyltransferase family 2 protein [Alphaproteobacteria bacterium]|nr:glycosyltransferase family 2 protein [Alphaproteobacteria bacterium]
MQSPGSTDGLSNEMAVSVIVPIHDEEKSVDRVVTETVDTLAPAGIDFEIIVVDDGSADGSWARIKALSKNESHVRGFRLRREFGKAAALSLGVQKARGSVIVTMDGDLQDDPAEIPKFLVQLAGGADLVSGWKKDRRDPLSKTLPSRLFNWATRRLGGVAIHDINCGFKAAREEVYRNIPIYGELHRYIPVLAHHLGYRVEEIPVRHRPREHGVSKYGWERYPRGALDLLTVLALTRYGNRPGHLFGGLGIVCGGAGLLILAYLAIASLTVPDPIGGWPLLWLAIILMVVSIQLIAVGLVAELVVNRTGGYPSLPLVAEATDGPDTAAPARLHQRLA